MQEEPDVFDVFRTLARWRQQCIELTDELVEQRSAQLILSAEVIVQVPGTDAELRRDQGRRYLRLAALVVERERDVENPLARAPAGSGLGAR